jgi:glycosyltransferase involved in cell wall biosynthesis
MGRSTVPSASRTGGASSSPDDRPIVISVVVPVRDAAATLPEQLTALARQTYQGEWEVVVADNGSRDGSRAIVESFRDRFPALRSIDASERGGPAFARNAGVRAARGDLIAFCDADDVVSERWVEALATALGDQDFVSGAMEYHTLNPEPVRSWGYRSHEHDLPVGHRFLAYALSANLGISRRAFEAVGGFAEDISLPAADDIDLSWRVQLAGFSLGFAGDAVVSYRLRSTLRQVWRQQMQYGAGVPLLFRRFRERGMPPGSILIGLYATAKLLIQIPMLASSKGRGVWVRTAAHRWGMFKGALAERVVYF